MKNKTALFKLFRKDLGERREETWERKQKMNKKGAEMTVGTIVIIVLALIVLVVLIVGFTSGWSSLWDKITSIFGGGPNVSNHVTGCTTACISNSEYDYCTVLRDVKFDDKSLNGKYNCAGLAAKNVGLDACDQFTCAETIARTKTCVELNGEKLNDCAGATEIANAKDLKSDQKCCAADCGPKTQDKCTGACEWKNNACVLK